MLKIETIVPKRLGEEIFDYCRNQIAPHHPNSVCTEQVDVLRKEAFIPEQINCGSNARSAQVARRT
jgi:hypothetical protein